MKKSPKRIVSTALLLWEWVEDEGRYVLVGAIDCCGREIDPQTGVASDEKDAAMYAESGIVPDDIIRVMAEE